MTQERRGLQRAAIGLIVGLVLLGVVLVAVDWRQARQVLGRADWAVVPVALLFTALSYACLSYGFVAVNRIFGIQMGQRDLFEVGFVSMTLSHLTSAAGYPLRILLMQRRGLAIGDSLAATLVHSYLNNLALFALFPFGLFNLLASHPFSRGQIVGVGLAAGLLALLFAVTAAVFFASPLRTAILSGLQKMSRRFTRRDIGAAVGDFESTLSRGMTVLRRRPLAIALPLSLIVADWAFTVIALGFCFRALGTAVSPGVLVTGFAVGIAAGLLSFVPGGLGVQEGSMAGVYALLGVPLQQALLASVLFRAVYYVIPFAVSLAFYWRLVREVRQPHP